MIFSIAQPAEGVLSLHINSMAFVRFADAFGRDRVDDEKARFQSEKMRQKQVLELLARSKLELRARFGVPRIAIFGSTARDAAGSGSDVDILVAFDGPATSRR